jgi:hypothetical protein
MPRSPEKPGREGERAPEDARGAEPPSAADAAAVATIRAHLQTSLGNIEAAVGALGFGSTGPAALDRERWRRVSALLQHALNAIEAAREVCERQAPGGNEPGGDP